jgi:glycosyltransferase involved in cell wall biosynthesis
MDKDILASDGALQHSSSLSPRFCVITEAIYPEDPSGQSRAAYDLAVALLKQGCDVKAVSRKMYSSTRNKEMVDGLTIEWLPPAGILKGRGWSAALPTCYFLLRVLIWLLANSRGYDVLIVHGTKQLLIPTLAVRFLLGKKCLVKIDSISELQSAITRESLESMNLKDGSLLVYGWRALRSFLLRSADGVVGISQQMHGLISQHGIAPDRTHIIPNGIDAEAFSPASLQEAKQLRSALGLPLERWILVYSGRLARSKGLPMLMRVWRTLARQYPQALLLLVGGGQSSYDNCESDLRRFVAEHALQESVLFAGQLPSVRNYLRAADAFVFPSDAEGFSIALAEAMACGLPCISTRVGIAPEVIVDGDNGKLVAPQDEAAFEHALEWLLRNRERWSAMGERARSAIVTRYGMAQVAHRYLEVSRRLLDSDDARLSAT